MRRAAVIARALAIILVVYAHVVIMFTMGRPPGEPFFPQGQFISAIIMPVFFMVSGAVFRVKSARDIATATLTLLFMSYALHILGWVINKATGFEEATLRTLVGPLVRNTGHAFPVVWYFVALALIQLLYQGYVKGSPLQKLAVVLILLASFVYATITGRNDWQAGALLPGVAFFVFGNWLFQRPRASNDLQRAIFAVLALAGAILTAPLNRGCPVSFSESCPIPWADGQFLVWLPAGEIGNIPLFFLTGALGCLGVFFIANLLARWGGKVEAWLSRLGMRTLDLIILNGFVLHYVQAFLATLFADHTPLAIAMPVAIALTAVQILVLPLALHGTRPFVKFIHERARRIVHKSRTSQLWAFLKPRLLRPGAPPSPSIHRS